MSEDSNKVFMDESEIDKIFPAAQLPGKNLLGQENRSSQNFYSIKLELSEKSNKMDDMIWGFKITFFYSTIFSII